MPIRVKLDHLLLERRITLTELADRIGITLANLSILKTNKARAVRFSTLEALCRELRIAPVAAGQISAPNYDFADFASSYGLTVVTNKRDFRAP